MAAHTLSGKAASAGFTYLGVLVLIAIMGASLASTCQLWSTLARRAHERELLWVGTQYAEALRSYYRASPGLAQYPKELDELVLDKRFPSPRHHLRRLYPDPITNSSDWGLLRGLDQRITGVYSQAQEQPLKQTGFAAQWSEFDGMEHYSDWQFVAEKATADGATQPAAASPLKGLAP